MSIKLQKAIAIANEHHKGQLRRDGTPYIDHPLRVSALLKKYDFPEDALISAVLHDICEDTDISNLHINELFGPRVGFIVNALSKNKKPINSKELKKEYDEKNKERKVSNLENYDNFKEYRNFRFHLYLNRMYTGIVAEPWIFFIKISDQIDNLSDMKPFRKEKKLRKINEVEKYFLPIYKKCEEIFIIDSKYIKLHKEFIQLLEETINQAKLNIIN